jgi:ABC-type transport system involved in multi-copper enzyme maturation permease subunit
MKNGFPRSLEHMRCEEDGSMVGVLKAEFLKMRGARIPRMCAIGIAGFPMVLGLPLAVLNKLGAIGDIMNGPSWKMFAEESLVFIVVFVSPVLLGLVATFLFAREFVEGTARNLFALPVSRTRVVFAKLMVLLCWSVTPPVLAFLVLLPLGLVLRLPGLSWDVLRQAFQSYALSGILIYSTLPLTCLVSMMSRGYIVPLAYTVLAIGVGLLDLNRADYTFGLPYSLPAALTISQVTLHLPTTACLILGGTFLAGVALCIVYLNKAQIDR